jgi:AraC-like DNA-binding protein
LGVFFQTGTQILLDSLQKDERVNLSRLKTLSGRYRLNAEGKNQPLPSLSVLWRNCPSNIEASIYEPVLCLILQGSKMAGIGDQTVNLTAGKALLVSHDLPVVSQITKASAQEPYVAVIVALDLPLIRSLYDQVADLPRPDANLQSLSIAPAEATWLAPLIRYFELMDNTMDARVLGPLIWRELHYRLLLSPIGQRLRNLLVTDSHASRIAKAIHRLRIVYRSCLKVPDLAKVAGMSTSSFHEHFKQVTGTTPLQFQKDLRLIDAKQLLMQSNKTVAEVAFAFGYESPTHFSRDYSRKFGVAPSLGRVYGHV